MGGFVPSSHTHLDQRVWSETLWNPPIENQGSQPLLIHPGFLWVAAIHGLLSVNYVVASEADRCFSSMKRSGVLDIHVSHIKVIYLV